MSTLLQRAERYFRRELWRRDISSEPFWRAWPMHLARCIAMAVERGLAHQLPIRASALTFVTVVSLVPSLAFMFSVAKGLGQDQFRSRIIDPYLEDMFGSKDTAANALPGLDSAAEVGSTRTSDVVRDDTEADADAAQDGTANPTTEEEPKLRLAIEQVLAIVENTDVKRLGALGFLVIVYAVIRLLGGIEQALNLTWSVERPRRIVRKIADYLAIVVVAPLLAVLATATTAALGTTDSYAIVFLRDTLGLGPFIIWIGLVLPIVTMWMVFTLLYLVMPNTKVRLRSAIFGGLTAAILWALVQELHVRSQVGVASYDRLYAGFAAFPIFLAWLWLSWLVVLAGAEFGYADQHQNSYRRQALSKTGNQAWFEVSVLRALGRIVDSFARGARPPQLVELSDDLGVPEGRLEEGLQRLESAGLLLRAGESGEDSFALARPAESVSVHEALAMLRGVQDLEVGGEDVLPDDIEGSAIDQRSREAYRETIEGRGRQQSLAEMALGASSGA